MRFNFFRLIALALFAGSATVSAFQGGPDDYGYYWESTQDPGDTITFHWIDPSGHAPLTGWYPNDDDGWVKIALPGRFPFYGDTLDTLIVCSNGFFQSPFTFTSYLNQALPVSRFPNLIAAFWDDLSPVASGSVRRFDDPGGAFTVLTWLDVVRFDTHDTLSFQVLLNADGTIRINVLRAPATANSSTIGIQGHSGLHGHYLEYLFDGTPAGHLPEDSLSLRFYLRRLSHDVGALRALTPTGWVPANSQVPVTGRFKNYGHSVETFTVTAMLVRAHLPHDTAYSGSRTVTDLAPGDSASCYFGDWLTPPSPDSWHYVLRTHLGGDMLPGNDTLRVLTSTAPLPFGTAIGSWGFPALGDGMNLTGICYQPDTNRFYFAAISPNRVFSFDGGSPDPDPVLEAFDLQDFFGDDLIWGIMWDPATADFWVGHVSNGSSGCMAARYHADGTFAGDTWNLGAIEPGVWFAALARGPLGTGFAVAVGGDNHIYQLDLQARSVIRTFGSPAASYRACSYLGDHGCYVVAGGWNQEALVKLGPYGAELGSAACPDLADLAVYYPEEPCRDSLVWAYATISNLDNTIRRISLGSVWANVGIAAGPLPRRRRFRVGPNPVRSGALLSLPGLPTTGTLRLWDAAGRLVRSERLSPHARPAWSATDACGRDLASGIYLLTLSNASANLTCKLVVLAGR